VTLCKLFGRTYQAYHQQRRREERAVFSGELVGRQVLAVRKEQKRIGGRKLYYLMSGFLAEHRLKMGRDAFFDLLRGHGLLVKRRRTRKPRTTLSCWWLKRYANLAKDMAPERANRLWVSDITYIRVRKGFYYLSLITDAYSRKIVGYHVSEDLAAAGCVAALMMALEANPKRSGLVHHSDRGVQYYSNAYMRTLGPKIRISMTEKSDPLENAIAERVNGILKQELLDEGYQSIAEARQKVAEAVDIYNNRRPHSSIGMLTPEQAHSLSGELKRLWKNYYKPNKAEASQATV
jgi:transposase InsO family protein